MSQLRILSRIKQNLTKEALTSSSSTFSASSLSCVIAGTAAIVALHDVTKTHNDAAPDTDTNEQLNKREPHVGIIETDFSDKLAAKPYLRHHNPLGHDSIFSSTIETTRRIWGKLARNDSPVVRHPADLEVDAVYGELDMNTEPPLF